MRSTVFTAVALAGGLLAGCPSPGPLLIGHDGLVVDARTQKPVEGAAVVMLHRDDVTGKLVECARAETDAEGLFAVEFPASGHPSSRAKGTSLRIEAGGFGPYTEEKPFSFTSPGTRLSEDGIKVYLLRRPQPAEE